VGVDGLSAAMRQAAKTHHPDAGGNADEFKLLSDLTEWLKTQVGRPGAFLVM
jgi:hypothetical protein